LDLGFWIFENYLGFISSFAFSADSAVHSLSVSIRVHSW
jgi:hypothetical protein